MCASHVQLVLHQYELHRGLVLAHGVCPCVPDGEAEWREVCGAFHVVSFLEDRSERDGLVTERPIQQSYLSMRSTSLADVGECLSACSVDLPLA